MNYPDFFNKVENIVLKDPLAEALGTFTDGLVEFSYTEIVKSAGHSCPTVAGAYLMTQTALKELYPDEIPVRGMIKIELPADRTEGVTGVIANVIGNITGATEDMGFKGLAGNFSRINLVAFNQDIACSAKFTRIDNNHSINITYDPSGIPANPAMKGLMQLTILGQASTNEKELFGKYWQERVKKILLNSDKYPSLSLIKNF